VGPVLILAPFSVSRALTGRLGRRGGDRDPSAAPASPS
jgi:hypothetical protein